MSQESGTHLNILRSVVGEELLQTHQYTKRQHHKKSRKGCLSCKTRRMKCDEVKPVCSRCRRNSWECYYTSDLYPCPQTTNSQGTVNKLNFRVMRCEFMNLGAENLFLVQHYDEVLSENLFPFPSWRTMHKQILQNAHQYPGVLHSMLAVSALHLRQLGSVTIHDQYEMKHSLYAVQSLQGCLRDKWWRSIDSTLTTSIFLSVLSFADVDPHSAVIPLSVRPRHQRFEWVGVQMGLRSLLEQLTAKQIDGNNSDSMWLSAFEDVHDTISDIFDDRNGDVDIPQEWAQFLGIDSTSLIETHPYLRVMRRLYHVTNSSTNVINQNRLGRCVQFVEGITPSFLSRLKDLDPRALILFAHWLMQLCRHNVWWCYKRAISECWLICHQLYSTTPKLRPWLEDVANTCAYNFGDA